MVDKKGGLLKSTKEKSPVNRKIYRTLCGERGFEPRYAFDVYTLSRRASSTTRASLLMKTSNYVIGIAAKGAMQIGCKDSVKRREYKIKKRLFLLAAAVLQGGLQGDSRLVR